MPNPNTRTITFQWINSQMSGDELLELWKKVAGVWSLVESIPVASTPEQTHEFTGSPGTKYSFQMRARRNGLYRADYQSTNPEDWPVGSRLDYTADLPVPVLARSLTVPWQRTSATEQYLGFTFSNFDAARPIRFWRDAGAGFTNEATIAAGVNFYDYLIQGGEGATTLDFYVDQQDDDSASGPPSNTLAVYAGPVKPTLLAQTGGPDNDGYTAHWTNGTVPGGPKTRLSDHWTGVYQNRTLTAASATTGTVAGLESNDPAIPSLVVQVNVRARHEITQFAVTDVSEWTADVLFNVRTAAGNTLYMGP